MRAWFVIVAALCLADLRPAHAQILRVYDLDATAFPRVSVDFDYYAIGGGRLEVTRDDILVREFTDIMPLAEFDCPPPQAPKSLSSVLMIDASRSMERDGRLQLAQDAARAWIEAQPLGPGECALATFSQSSSIIRDFSTDRDDLFAGVDEINTLSGTDFNAAFTAPPAGATFLAAQGSQKRVIVLITDGDGEGDADQIIAAAQAAEATVYCVAIGREIPDILFEIAAATGGLVFDNIVSREAAERTFVRILRHAQEVELCRLSWTSGPLCESQREVLVSIPQRGAVDFTGYLAPANSIPQLAVTPLRLEFGEVAPPNAEQQQVELRAVAAAIDVNAVNDFHPDYTIVDWGGSAPPFRLEDGESRILTVEFRPADSSYSGHEFPVESEGACNIPGVTVFGGFRGIKPSIPTLKVEVPNGGELYPAGETIDVNWSGVPRRDSLRLELSTDGGNQWTRISESATELNTQLVLPNIVSDDCLIRLSQGAVAEDSVDGWSWALRGGGSTSFSEEARDICVDSSGNVYAVGSYFGEADFGDTDVISIGSTDIFVAKLRADGSFVWVRSLGAAQGDEGMAIACDAEGNVYIAGEMRLSVTTDGGTYESRGGQDVFLAKFNSGGIGQWIRGGGGERTDGLGDLAVTPDGRAYISGSVIGRANFDGESIADDGVGAHFVAQYSTDGDLNWINANVGSFSFRSCCLDLNPDQELALSGLITEDEVIDGINLTAGGSSDVFVARLDPANGRARSAFVIGQAGAEFASGLALGSDGRITVTGEFENTLDLGAGPLTSRGRIDFFVAQYDASNQLRWAWRGGGSEEDGADAVQADGQGGAYLLALARDNFDIDGEAFSADNRDIVVVKISQDGSREWVRLGGGEFSQRARGMVYDKGDWLYFAGEFLLSAEIGTSKLTAAGNGDAMLAAMRINLEATQSDVSDNTWSIVAPQFVGQRIDMGVVAFGTQRDSLVSAWLNNVGPLAMIIDDIRIEGTQADDFEILSPVPQRLATGESLDIRIAFKPSAIGPSQAQIVVYAAGAERRFEIVGNAVAEKIRTFFENDIVDFGGVALGRSRTQAERLLLARISAQPVVFDAIVIEESGSSQQFSLPGDLEFPFEFGIGETLALDLTFTPTRRGRSNADLLFFCNGLAAPLRIPMTGLGLEDVVLIPDISGAVGEVVDMQLQLGRPLTSDQAQVVSSFTALISFPADVLVPVDGSGTVDAVGERSISVSGSLQAGEQTLASIPMAVVLGSQISNPLLIQSIDWFDAAGNPVDPGIARVGGVFILSGFCEVGGDRLFDNRPGRAAALSAPQPNPAKHTATIPLHLIELGLNKLQIFSIRGELEYEQVLQVTKPGAFELSLDCSFLPNGRYILVLRTPTQLLEQHLDVRR